MTVTFGIQSILSDVYRNGRDVSHVTDSLRTDFTRWLNTWESVMSGAGVVVHYINDISSPLLPNNLAEINESMGNHDLYVFSGGTDSVWGTDLNNRFRAVHDFQHYLAQADFTLEGEIEALKMGLRLGEVSDQLEQALFSEVVLQAAAVIDSLGTFPPQRLVATSKEFRDSILGR